MGLFLNLKSSVSEWKNLNEKLTNNQLLNYINSILQSVIHLDCEATKPKKQPTIFFFYQAPFASG